MRPWMPRALCAAALAATGLMDGAAIAQPVVIGAEDDAAPWSYPDGTGYVNELVRAAFKESGWDFEQKVLPYARCKALAARGMLAGCFSVGRKPELEASFLYPDQPVFSARNLLVARGDSPLEGCDPRRWAARGTAPRIGFVRGYEYVDAVEALAQRPVLRIETTNSEQINLRKLHAGHIHATVINVDEVKPMAYIAQSAGVANDFKIVCDFGALPVYMAFSRAHSQGAAALTAYNAGIAALQSRGGINVLQAAWRVRAQDKIGMVKR